MSASLVGSEMCIRDSSPGAGATAPCDSPEKRLRPGEGAQETARKQLEPAGTCLKCWKRCRPSA
eukprot:14428953-Alexandrium_andersonii.AAC.1